MNPFGEFDKNWGVRKLDYDDRLDPIMSKAFHFDDHAYFIFIKVQCGVSEITVNILLNELNEHYAEIIAGGEHNVVKAYTTMLDLWPSCLVNRDTCRRDQPQR